MKTRGETFFLTLILTMALLSLVRLDAQTFTTLHQFSGGNDGSRPFGGLLLSGGTLYGAVTHGGTGGTGVIVALNTNGTGYTNLYNFTPPTGVNANFQPINADGT